MRVLHLVKTGVGASWAVRQVAVLAQAGVEVHVAVPDGPRVSDYLAAGARLHVCQPGLVPTDPRSWRSATRTVRDLVARVAPDLVHSHFVDTTLAMRLALRDQRLPRVFQVPGPLHLENPITRAVELSTAQEQDHWVATCRWVESRYRASGVPEDRVHLSYYGTDTRAFLDAPAHEGTLRSELGLDDGTALIGMVAYMYAPKRYLGQRRGLKGHEDLIAAVARIGRRERPLHVVFAGGPWAGAERYEATIRSMAAELLPGRHTFLGHRTDVPNIYASLDLAVHPSHSENLGGAAESLLAGVPTVATRVGGFPDLVVPGVTGWLAEPRDPASLARSISDALTEPRARAMALAGRDRTRDLLDVSLTGRQVLELYRQILPSHRSFQGDGPGT